MLKNQRLDKHSKRINVSIVLPVLFIMILLGGCGASQMGTSSIEYTEWIKANIAVGEEFDAQKIDRVTAFIRMWNNCVLYTTYQYQRELCTALSQYFTSLPSLLSRYGNKPEAVKGLLPLLTKDNLESIKLYFPLVPLFSKRNECMMTGDPAEKFACANYSRTLDSFANGLISLTEFKARIAEYHALREVYQSSQPTALDALFGVMKAYSDSIPKTYNCYGQVSGNQVYTNCR